MSRTSPIGSDWEDSVRKNVPTAAGAKDKMAAKAMDKFHRGPTEGSKAGSRGIANPCCSHTFSSNKLAQARKAMRMDQAQLAQKISVTTQVIQAYESGKAIPDNKMIRKLESVLGTKLD